MPGTRGGPLIFGDFMWLRSFPALLILALSVEAAPGADATPEERVRADARACHDAENGTSEVVATCTRAIDSPLVSGAELARLYNDRGWAHEQMGDSKAAYADYLRATEIDPEYNRAARNLGWLEGDRDNWDAALRIADGIIARDPADGHSHGLRGWALRNLDRPAEALDAHTIALALEPGDDWIMRELAYTQLELGAPDKALDHAERALRTDPGDLWNPYTVGYVHSNQGRFAEAIENFDQAYAIDPNDLDLLLERGYALRSVERYDAALADFEKAITLEPTDYRAYEQIGWAEMSRERFKDAEAAFLRALPLLPPDRANPRYALARIFAATDRTDGAIEELERALAIEYQDWNAREVLRVLLREGAMLGSITASRMINRAARAAEE